jgi:hypothetical protein
VLVLRRPNTEHRQENPALVGVVRVCGYNTPGLARGVIGQRFDVADVTMVGFRRHCLTVREVDIS